MRKYITFDLCSLKGEMGFLRLGGKHLEIWFAIELNDGVGLVGHGLFIPIIEGCIT